MPSRFSRQLKAHRRRAGLAQREIGVLLGDRSESRVGRYERGTRLPPLRIALAYQIIFGKAIADLFPDEYEAAESFVKRNAKRLRLTQAPKNVVLAARRKGSLEALLRR
jgi:transcriptional regulator with XRE-family HTH domain